MLHRRLYDPRRLSLFPAGRAPGYKGRAERGRGLVMDDRFRVRQVRVQGDRAVASAKQTMTNFVEALGAITEEINETPLGEMAPKIEAAQKVCTGFQQALTALSALEGTVSSIKA